MQKKSKHNALQFKIITYRLHNSYIGNPSSNALMSVPLRKNLPFIAIVVLIVGISSTVYVHASKQVVNTDNPMIIIHNQEYEVLNLFTIFSLKTVITDDGEFTGIPLNELIVYAGVNQPMNYQYTIIADGYQQTVKWESMQNGIFWQEELRVIFPELAHSFWVYDVLEIKVV